MPWFTLVATTQPEHGQSIGNVPKVDWLDPKRAWCLRWFDVSRQAAEFYFADLTAEKRSPNADYNILEGEPRKMHLLVADMESTIIEQEMLDELAEHIGLRAKVSSITERAMRGELDFEAAVTERVALLEGLDAAVLDELAENRLTYMPGARQLVATMKANGAYCALVSGGFTHFTAKVVADLGFDEHHANSLEVRDGKLTGRVVPPILGRDAKLATLQRLTSRLSLDPKDTIAVGDGANDLAMLKAAGLGVAFRAKPLVRDEMAAHSSGAVIDHCDLTGLLYLQGYADTDIRSDLPNGGRRCR